jgi:hypothetical protein
MEGLSGYSMKNEKKITGTEPKLMPDQALEILQTAILQCQHAGISAKVALMMHQPEPTIVIVLAGVQLMDGRLVLV